MYELRFFKNSRDSLAMRIYIDCTHTYHSELNTGIQRVVRNIVNHSKNVGKSLGVDCIPIIQSPDGYVRITDLNYNLKKRFLFRVRWRLNDYYSRIIRHLTKRLSSPRIVRFLKAGKHEFGLTWLILLFMSPVKWLWRFQNRVTLSNATIDDPHPLPQNGDILLMPDKFWDYDFYNLLAKAKRDGAIIIPIIHDLFPISHPEFYVNKTHFEISFRKLYLCADGFLCNSDNTQKSLVDYLQTQPCYQDWQSKRFDYFHLGAELDTVETNGRIRDAIKTIFANDAQVYLAVGTIEPRKNHVYLLNVLNILLQKGSHATLVVVGRIGWLCDEIVVSIRSHPMFGSRLFFFDDASDSELEFCYSHAKALLCPSINEGFGLPVIEAQMKGLPVFASDITVFREVAGASAAYFDNTDPHSLADMLLEYEESSLFPAEGPHGFTWLTWADSTAQMLTKLIQMTDEIKSDKAKDTSIT
jgi:alpha-1,2-rhamnosyltransferase